MNLNLEQVETKVGPVWISSDVDKISDTSVIDEVITRDGYRVQELHAQGYKPETILDIGMNHGLFTLLCGRLWPEARILAFEPQLLYVRHAMVNLPDNALPVCLPVIGTPKQCEPELHSDQRLWSQTGHFLNGVNLCELVRSAKGNALLKIDNEGGEMNLMRELKEMGGFVHFSIITGEWHFEKAQNIVREALTDDYDIEFTNEGECGHFFARRK